jgi:PIN domain nuclease of toxin-antitoxin system
MGRHQVNLLLDTHIWLWSLLEPERLARPVATALADPATRRWLSPLSVWEALLLIERGRLVVDMPPEAWLREALSLSPMEEAPVTTEVAFASRALATRHRDPVDRFLVATAQVFDLTLVTADSEIHRVGGVRLMKNHARGGQARARHPRPTR